MMESLVNFQNDVYNRINKAKINFKKTPKERITKFYVESKLEALDQLWADFKVGHKELIKTVDYKLLSEHNYVTADVYEKAEEIFTQYKCDLKNVLAGFLCTQSRPSVDQGDLTVNPNQVRLPKISIPSFSGKYTEWTTFRDLFISMIHNNKSLDNVQKLHYLKGYLTGEAEQLIRYTPVSDANYIICWNQLEKRYNNKKYLSHCILKRLLSQKNATSESAGFLKELMDTSSDCLNALANLGIDISTWDIIVIHLLTLKLDHESRKQWELSVASNVDSDALPTFEQFKEFLTSRYRALEFIEPRNTSKFSNTYTKPTTSNYTKPNVLHATNAVTISCEYCKGSHKLCFCKTFAGESYATRHAFVTNNRMCYNCLGSNHSVRFCQKVTNCQICKRRHHSLLHPKEVITSTANYSKVDHAHDDGSEEDVCITTDSSSNEVTPIVNCFAKGSAKHEILLATALIRAESKTGDWQVIRALLDQGSQASFVTEEVVQTLRLKKIAIKGMISGLGGDQTSVMSKHMVLLKIQSLIDPDFRCEVKAFVLNKITTYLPGKKLLAPDWTELNQLTLADPTYTAPNKIDVLLGAEVYSQIIKEGVLRGPLGAPVAQSTTLGWILSGPIKTVDLSNITTVLHSYVRDDDHIIKRFWEIEAEPVLSPKLFTAEERRCEELYASTTRRDAQGRYVVKLPFHDNEPLCNENGKSREIAVKRLHTLERKLAKDQNLKEKYAEVLNEYKQLGHMVEITEPDHQRNKAVYLPHHAVIREDKTTTKVRVVFDASCKNAEGVSLNDMLMTGPTLQPDLRHLIMRWRQYPVCLVADIVKMYRMVRVNDEDTNFQRIVWREDPEKEIKDYKLLTVTFGTASAPYLAVKSLNQVAIDYQAEYPHASKRVCNQFYMDDLMTGCQTEEEGLILYEEMKALLEEGGFILQKWASNKVQLLKMIMKKENAQKQNPCLKDDLKLGMDDIVKILGLTWHRNADEFQYTVNLPPLSPPATKRKIIADVSRLFDPLGWIAPCLITAKIFIQRLWIAGVGWDEEPPTDILQDWLTYRNQLSQLIHFRIPRWVFTNSKDAEVELHGFSDASNMAYAAVVYIRVRNTSGKIDVAMIGAKTRVAPVKQISIPRLELCGAGLAAKLLVEIATVMDIPKQNIRAWTDSTVVLAWLNKHPSNWKTFVANRVSEILTTLESSQWFHVSTKENPADCASRGVLPVELEGHELWKFGPKFLHDEHISYTKLKNNETQIEKSAKVHVGLVTESILDKYSSLTKLLRIVAFCRRWITKRSVQQTKETFQSLAKRELDDAMICCIKLCQRMEFANEISEIKKYGFLKTRSSKLISLTPFMDNGVLRVGGRIKNSQESEDIKHPVILPHDSQFTKLIVADAHAKTLHGGPQLMLNYLRSAYWIIKAKNLVKQHVGKCISCIRQKIKTQTQLMGSLPSARVTPGRAFIRSGVDYAGPINLRVSKGKGQRSYKGYVCLFVCMVTKAIHLEVVSDLTSRGFLEAFKRFVSRRGHCLEVYSDNGTNFVGASRELKYLFDMEKSNTTQEIVESLASTGTTWHFIPARSPNFGGLWEAGIKSTKHHIRRVIGDSTLTFEEMTTLLCQIEACLNSRPISVLPNEPGEPNPLTPGHFLIGQALVTVPEINYETSSMSNLKRWQMTQKMLQNFWRRWSAEYLTHCVHRYKWAYHTPEPNVGDVVLVKEDDLPPTKWLFGRILQKHPGTDNLTRVVTIKCKNALIKRPTSKLCILPVTD